MTVTIYRGITFDPSYSRPADLTEIPERVRWAHETKEFAQSNPAAFVRRVLNTNEVGIHWTTSVDYARTRAHRSWGAGIVLHGDVDDDHVIQVGSEEYWDIAHEQHLMPAWSVEKEVTVREGSPVTITGFEIWVDDVDGPEMVDEFDFPMQVRAGWKFAKVAAAGEYYRGGGFKVDAATNDVMRAAWDAHDLHTLATLVMRELHKNYGDNVGQWWGDIWGAHAYAWSTSFEDWNRRVGVVYVSKLEGVEHGNVGPQWKPGQRVTLDRIEMVVPDETSYAPGMTPRETVVLPTGPITLTSARIPGIEHFPPFDEVMYHGTRTEVGFGRNFGGIHFGPREAALERLYNTPGNRIQGRPQGEKIVRARVTLKRPYGSVEEPRDDSELVLMIPANPNLPPVYDGIVYRNIVEDPGSISVLCFDASSYTVLDVEDVEAMFRGTGKYAKTAMKLVYPTTKLQPGEMFHLAPRDKRDAIDQEGLHAPGGIFMWDNIADVDRYRSFWAGRDFDLYIVRPLDMRPDDSPGRVEGAFVTDAIPVDRIARVSASAPKQASRVTVYRGISMGHTKDYDLDDIESTIRYHVNTANIGTHWSKSKQFAVKYATWTWTMPNDGYGFVLEATVDPAKAVQFEVGQRYIDTPQGRVFAPTDLVEQELFFLPGTPIDVESIEAWIFPDEPDEWGRHEPQLLKTIPMHIQISAASGDGHLRCSDGVTRWGRYGAAGVLFKHEDKYFLARRGGMVTGGAGQWAIPGGALDSDEDPLTGALREAREEVGGLPANPRLVDRYVFRPVPEWSYTTVVVEVDEPFVGEDFDWETDDSGWFTAEQIRALDLYAPVRDALRNLRIASVTVSYRDSGREGRYVSNGKVLEAVSGGTVVGHLEYRAERAESLDESGYVEIWDVAVDPEFQHEGIASGMLDHLVQSYDAKSVSVRTSMTLKGQAWMQRWADTHPDVEVEGWKASWHATKTGALTVKDYEGEVGNRDHVTRREEGTLPTSVVATMPGVMGETPGAHANRQGERWQPFLDDIAAHGITEPIFITVDYDDVPKISEGNHRRDAAVELGLPEVPVEIRYFGHAEQQGSVADRAHTGSAHTAGTAEWGEGGWLDSNGHYESTGNDSYGPKPHSNMNENWSKGMVKVRSGRDELNLVWSGELTQAQMVALRQLLRDDPVGHVYVDHSRSAIELPDEGTVSYTEDYGVDPRIGEYADHSGDLNAQVKFLRGISVGARTAKLVPRCGPWRPGWKLAKVAAADDYRGRHQPSQGPPVYDLLEGDMMPDDVYDHPEWYTGYTERAYIAETIRVLRDVRGKPDAMVTIYRASPPEATTINRGDWVSLSLSYARDHAARGDPEGTSRAWYDAGGEVHHVLDWPVHVAQVPARTVLYAGDDLMEWGYWGPDISARTAKFASIGPIKDRTLYRAFTMPLVNPHLVDGRIVDDCEIATAQELIDAVMEEWGGLGAWWGEEAMAKGYSGELHGGGDDTMVVGVQFPQEVIDHPVADPLYADGIVLADGTRGTLVSLRAWRDGRMQDLAVPPGLSVIAARPITPGFPNDYQGQPIDSAYSKSEDFAGWLPTAVVYKASDHDIETSLIWSPWVQEELKRDIEANGIGEPLEMSYGRLSERSKLRYILNDGNHRARAAYELKIPKLPVIVSSSDGMPPGLEQGRKIARAGPGPGRTDEAKSRELAQDTVEDLLSRGGFTVSTHGIAPRTGWMVGIGEEQVFPSVTAITPTAVERYMDAHDDQLEPATRYLGGWINTADGSAALDVSECIQSRPAAIVEGKKNGEIAIYNIGTHEEITLAKVAAALTHVRFYVDTSVPPAEIARFVQQLTPAQIANANQAIDAVGIPPAGSDLVREFAITPVGDDFFAGEADDLSRSYRDMAILDPAVAPLWVEFGELCVTQAAELGKVYEIIRYDDHDPYETAAQMHADIDRGVYKVTSLHSHHPVWSVDTNVAFRVAHDLLGHGVANSDFSFRGEVAAYQAECMVTPEHLWPVLFSEIIGQSAYANTHHLFGEQKVGLLPITQAEIDADVGKVMDQPDVAYDAMHRSAKTAQQEHIPGMRTELYRGVPCGWFDPDYGGLELETDAGLRNFIRDWLRTENLGTHWTANWMTARGFALDESVLWGGTSEPNSENDIWVGLILHADIDLDDQFLEGSPEWNRQRETQMLIRGEKEVLVRKGAEVHVTEVEVAVKGQDGAAEDISSIPMSLQVQAGRAPANWFDRLIDDSPEGIKALYEDDPQDAIATILDLDTAPTLTGIEKAKRAVYEKSQAWLRAQGFAEKMTVWRAGDESDIRGREVVPVTYSRDTARFFARGADPPQFTVRREDIVAVVTSTGGVSGRNGPYFGGNLEGEMLARPSSLQRTAVMTWKPLKVFAAWLGPDGTWEPVVTQHGDISLHRSMGCVQLRRVGDFCAIAFVETVTPAQQRALFEYLRDDPVTKLTVSPLSDPEDDTVGEDSGPTLANQMQLLRPFVKTAAGQIMKIEPSENGKFKLTFDDLGVIWVTREEAEEAAKDPEAAKKIIKRVSKTGANQWTKYGPLSTRNGPPEMSEAAARAAGYTEGPYYHSTDRADAVRREGFHQEGAERFFMGPGDMEEYRRFGHAQPIFFGPSRDDVEGYGAEIVAVMVKPGKASDADTMTLGGGMFVSDARDIVPLNSSAAHTAAKDPEAAKKIIKRVSTVTHKIRVTPALLRDWSSRDISGTIEWENENIERSNQANPYRVFADNDYRTGTYELTTEQVEELLAEAEQYLDPYGLGGEYTTVGMRNAWTRLREQCRAALAAKTASSKEDDDLQRAVEELARAITDPAANAEAWARHQRDKPVKGFIEGPNLAPRLPDGSVPKYLYRVAHADEWAEAQQRGYLQSRGGNTGENRVHASAEPITAFTYGGGPYVTLRIRYEPADGWRVKWSLDEAFAVTDRVPLDRVEVISKTAKLATETWRLYHGTTTANLEAIRRDGQIKAADPEAVARMLEAKFDLPHDAVWRSSMNEFSHGRVGDDKIYLSEDPETAKSYASVGSEMVDDGLTAVFYELFPEEREKYNSPALKEWKAAHWREIGGTPIVLSLDVPWSRWRDTMIDRWMEMPLNRDMKPEDFTLAWYRDVMGKSLSTTVMLPGPLPASWIVGTQPVAWMAKRAAGDYEQYRENVRTYQDRYDAAYAETLMRLFGKDEDAGDFVMDSEDKVCRAAADEAVPYPKSVPKPMGARCMVCGKKLAGDPGDRRRCPECARAGRTAAKDGDTRPFGEYEMRYSQSDQGERKPRHIIETFHGGDKVGELNWYGTTGTIHHVDVEHEHSRKGIASAMWEWGQEMRPRPKHSRDRTTQGDAWARSVGGPLPRRSRAKLATEYRDSIPPPGPYFHGTNVKLAPGDEIHSASFQNYDSRFGDADYYDSTKVYLTTEDHLAERYAVGLAGRRGGEPHVYECRPIGQLVRDIEYLETGFGADQVMCNMAEVIREVPLPGLSHWDNGAMMRGPAKTSGYRPGWKFATCRNRTSAELVRHGVEKTAVWDQCADYTSNNHRCERDAVEERNGRRLCKQHAKVWDKYYGPGVGNKTAALTWKRTEGGWVSADRRIILERGARMTHGANAWLIWVRDPEQDRDRQEWAERAGYSVRRRYSEITFQNAEPDEWYIDAETEGGWLSEAKTVAEAWVDRWTEKYTH